MTQVLSKQIDIALAKKGWNKSDLADAANISKSYLSDILKGNRTGKKPQEHINKIKMILNIKGDE